MLSDDLEGSVGMGSQEGEDIQILMSDSCCTAEINTTLESNYSPLKIKFLRVNVKSCIYQMCDLVQVT